MIARPIAASAAATVMIKKTMICPSGEFADLAKVIKARLAALSIISMDINCVMRSLFTKKAMAPRTKRTTLKIKK
jgi:hypothetical protein